MEYFNNLWNSKKLSLDHLRQYPYINNKYFDENLKKYII